MLQKDYMQARCRMGTMAEKQSSDPRCTLWTMWSQALVFFSAAQQGLTSVMNSKASSMPSKDMVKLAVMQLILRLLDPAAANKPDPSRRAPSICIHFCCFTDCQHDCSTAMQVEFDRLRN